MAMAHLKIDNEKRFKFEKNDEVLIFTVTKDGEGLNDEFGLTVGVVDGVDNKGKITELSVIPHNSKEEVLSGKHSSIKAPVNKFRVSFDEWFSCTSGSFNGKTLPLYKIANSQYYVLIKNVLRPVGRM